MALRTLDFEVRADGLDDNDVSFSTVVPSFEVSLGVNSANNNIAVLTETVELDTKINVIDIKLNSTSVSAEEELEFSMYDFIRGKDGQDGKDGKDGRDGRNGINGQNGRTPVKGVDYWTDSDKLEIVNDILQDPNFLSELNNKQDILVSGTNIKTINGNSILGSGNIVIEEGGTDDYEELENLPSINNVELTGNKTSADLGLLSTLTIDAKPIEGSANPVLSGGVFTVLDNLIADGGLYGGVVTPNDRPPFGDDYRYYYLALTPGRYVYFNNYEVDTDALLFYWLGSHWGYNPLWIKGQALSELLGYKAEKVGNATNGNLAGLDEYGNLTDSGNKASDFATAAQGALADSAYQKPQTGIPASDLAQAVQTSLGKADTALQSYTETDPTVPSWAKQSTKPSYDYSEIGNTPDLSGFITKSVNDLANYYLKSETYTKTEVTNLIAAINQFHYEIYTTLPQNGESNVLYLIGPTGSGSDKYEEYVYSNSAFTKIGDTSIDLSGYVTTSALNSALAGYVSSSDLATALALYTPTSQLSTVATSGDYDDLTNTPTNVSAFTNDAGYLTQHQDISGKADKVVYVDASTPPSTMDANKVYQYGTLSGNTTFPAFTAVSSGDTEVKIWCWTFTTPSTAPTITWPAGITAWNGGSAPTINASKNYEVSVMDGVACIVES